MFILATFLQPRQLVSIIANKLMRNAFAMVNYTQVFWPRRTALKVRNVMWQNALHIHKHGRTGLHTLMCVREQASRNRVQEIQRDESECGGLSALSLFTGRVLPGQLPYTSAVIIMCHANLETPAWTKKLVRAAPESRPPEELLLRSKQTERGLIEKAQRTHARGHNSGGACADIFIYCRLLLREEELLVWCHPSFWCRWLTECDTHTLC